MRVYLCVCNLGARVKIYAVFVEKIFHSLD